ncbi:MAG: hypothetical protein U5K31_09830 [Balneolaceae bacterium]|nr:hypothetical protein [Balneolaceae bacterium]
MIKPDRRFTAVAIALFLTGCMATIQNATEVSYTSPDYSSEQLKEDGLAILPITAGSGLEGYRRPFGNWINHYVDSVGNREFKYSDWQTTMSELNDAGLSDDYNEAISSYRQTSVLDQSFLSELQSEVGPRFYLYIQLGNFEQTSNTEYNIFSGLETTRTNEVNAYAQIWDAQTGDVVWEALSEATASSNSDFVALSDNPGEYSRILAEGLAIELLGTQE